MVKEPKKARKLQTNPFLKELEPNSNTINSVNFPNKKPKSQIDKDYYQKNKEKKKQQRKERYQQQKQQTEKQEKEQTSKYYGAEAIKILMSLKEYTELNSAKRKLWLDFIWTLKDLNKTDISNIIEVMRIRELAENLINDYWETAKNEIKKGKSWNSLDQDQKDRLIRYWGYEKARKENNYLEIVEKLEKQSQEYLKEIELAKFHEERGKVKCPCYSCEEKKAIRKEVKAKIDKELKELEEQEADNEKGKCCVCGKIRVLDEENGVCKKCSEDYGN